MKELAIFIDSFDGHKDVWNNFFMIFDYFWPKCPYNRYLSTNEKDYERDNVTVVKVGKEVDWITTTLIALKSIKEKYVWLFHDDGFLSKKINDSDIEEIIDYMNKNNIFFYRLSLRKDLDKKYIRHEISSDFVYAINLQPAIWNTNEFIGYLEKLKVDGEKSPWDFERYFIEHFRNMKCVRKIEGIAYDTRDLAGIKNAIIQGKWVRHVLNFYKKNYNIVINIGDRKLMPISAEFFDFLKRKGHSLFTYRMRSTIKYFLSKLGFKFMT